MPTDLKIVTVATPTTQVKPAPTPPARSARSTATTPRYVCILNGGEHAVASGPVLSAPILNGRPSPLKSRTGKTPMRNASGNPLPPYPSPWADRHSPSSNVRHLTGRRVESLEVAEVRAQPRQPADGLARPLAGYRSRSPGCASRSRWSGWARSAHPHEENHARILHPLEADSFCEATHPVWTCCLTGLPRYRTADVSRCASVTRLFGYLRVPGADGAGGYVGGVVPRPGEHCQKPVALVHCEPDRRSGPGSRYASVTCLRADSLPGIAPGIDAVCQSLGL